MSEPTEAVLEVEIHRHDAKYSWLSVAITFALMLINRLHPPDSISIPLGVAALVSFTLLLIRQQRGLGWQALRITHDGIAFGDTGAGMTGAQISGWYRDRGGARLWSPRMSMALRARPGDEERLAAMLRDAFGPPVRLAPRGSKATRAIAATIAGAGAITICFAFTAKSLVPTYVGIPTLFIGLAALLVLRTSRVIRSDV